MPYHWTDTPAGPVVLTLQAHRSLPRRGFAAVILIISVMFALPLLAFSGKAAFWWLLPFFIAAVWALWAALRRSYRDGYVSEQLTRDADILTLTHRPARGAAQSWDCNIYWVRAEIHKTDGPVPQYITLSGKGRQVELGRFLSEDERVALFVELNQYLDKAQR
ncbi:DUF2244 domain-containing protein [Cognatishimia sp. WU-CL00825]|uniref:DUF2244 domain-containing protein n=1 Tax=Cognatishimia sp. WU-CL00825 TaxID=3127658 RepID=UPI0031022FB3